MSPSVVETGVPANDAVVPPKSAGNEKMVASIPGANLPKKLAELPESCPGTPPAEVV